MIQFQNNKYFYLIILLLLSALYYSVCIANPNKDFDIFIGASKLVSEGESCYDVWIHSGKEGLKYFYSPLFAVLLFPLRNLSQLTYNSIWFILNIFLLWRIFKLIDFYVKPNFDHPKKTLLFYTLCLFSVLRFTFDNLQLGQMTIFLLWGSLESLRFIQLKKIYKGAAILALIINIKIIPIAFLILLLYKAEFKAALLTILFLVISLLIPIPFIGYQFNQVLINDWWHAISATNNNSILEDYGRQSLSSFIPALLMDTPIQFNIKRNLVHLDVNSIHTILNITRLLFLLFVAILLGKPFQKFKSDKDTFYAIAVVSLCIPLIFPHQGKYSFFYLLPAYTYVLFILFQILNENKKHIHQSKLKIILLLLSVSFALLTLSTDGLIGRRLSDVCEYLNFITIGAFFLLAAIYYVKNKNKLTD